MGKLLNISYWFNLRPNSMSASAFRYLVVFVIILVIAAIAFAMIKRANKKGIFFRVWRKLSSFSLSNAIIGIFFSFFIYEQLPFLSARFWLFFWSLGMLVWLFFIVQDFIKIPKIKQKIAEKKEFDKYIP